MKNLALCILKCGNDIRISDIENNLTKYHSISISDIEYEFGASIEDMINLGMVYAPPNKISMILEFEKIKEKLGVVPTREEFDKHSKIQSSQYESEFQSWEHMLERLGYDPWYRGKANSTLPTSEDIMLPLLEFLSDSHRRSYSEVINRLADHFKLTQQSQQMEKASGGNLFYNKVGWAKTHLMHAGILQKKRKTFVITAQGLDILKQKPSRIDKKFLKQLEESKLEKSCKNEDHIRNKNIKIVQESTNEPIHRLDDTIDKVLRLIKSSQNGAYTSDIKMLLEISPKEMNTINTEITRIDGISKKEIFSEGILTNVLFKYDEPIKSPNEKYKEKQYEGTSKKYIHKTDKDFVSFGDPDYYKIFDKYLKNIHASSSYQYAILYALVDVGKYGAKEHIVGQRWIRQYENKIIVDLNFIAIRFIKYYWDIINSELRHTSKGMAVANKKGGDVNILDHIKEENLQGFPNLTTLSNSVMEEFRKKIINKSMKPEVLRVITNNLTCENNEKIIHKAYDKNSIEFDESFLYFLKYNADKLQDKISKELENHLKRINQDTKLKDVDLSADNPFYLFLKNRKQVHQDNFKIDRTNKLIAKALTILKYFEDGIYFSDLKKILSISDEEIKLLAKIYGQDMTKFISTTIADKEFELLVPKLVRIHGMSKKDIQHNDQTLETLLKYNPAEENNNEPDMLSKSTDSELKTQKLYDKIWSMYSTSDKSRSLYVKYQQAVSAFDESIEEIMHKKYISFRINGKNIVGVVPKKSKITVDFSFDIQKLNDPQKILQDISQIGSWTSGKSRINVFDENDLKYSIEITKQCYEHMTSKTVFTLQEKEPIHTRNRSKQMYQDTQNEISNLVIEMINEHASNRIDKNLKRQLTQEFIDSRSVKHTIKNNSSLSKEMVKRHIRTSLRLPDSLRVMENSGYLHPNPECSLQIALFAVNHYDWDGEKYNDEKVIQLAQTISKYLTTNMHLREAFSKKIRISKSDVIDDKHMNQYQSHSKNINGVSAATAIWIATATLHQQYGIRCYFSNKDIVNQVIKQNLTSVNTSTIQMHVSSHCVANNKARPNKHRKLYRVSNGRYRLYRTGDYYNPSRAGGQAEPNIEEIPEQYKDLLKWHKDEFCSKVQ